MASLTKRFDGTDQSSVCSNQSFVSDKKNFKVFLILKYDFIDKSFSEEEKKEIFKVENEEIKHQKELESLIDEI